MKGKKNDRKYKTNNRRVAAVALLVGGGWAYRYATAPVTGAIDAREQIFRGSNRISRHDEFYNLCATAQTQQTMLSNHESDLQFAESNEERERIRRNINGVRAQLHRTVNQYNARNSYTRGRFLASNLPYQLNAEGTITCQAN